jgi:hypothetical protein
VVGRGRSYQPADCSINRGSSSGGAYLHSHLHSHSLSPCLPVSLPPCPPARLAVCPPVRLSVPQGSIIEIRPFLTASNSIHPPKRPIDVPSLPNHRTVNQPSNPIRGPTHIGTRQPLTPLHRTQTDQRDSRCSLSLTHPASPVAPKLFVRPSFSTSAARHPGSDLPADIVRRRTRRALTLAITLMLVLIHSTPTACSSSLIPAHVCTAPSPLQARPRLGQAGTLTVLVSPSSCSSRSKEAPQCEFWFIHSWTLATHADHCLPQLPHIRSSSLHAPGLSLHALSVS